MGVYFGRRVESATNYGKGVCFGMRVEKATHDGIGCVLGGELKERCMSDGGVFWEES